MSRLLREAGDVETARAHVMRALKIAPHDAQIHFESALVHRRAGDARESIAAYERALELKPDFIAARINLGLMYLSVSGDPSRAQKQFERAIEIDPACVAAQANLGLALEEQGRIDEAITHYEKLIAANPAENEYRWNRGLALLGSGDFARGWEDYGLRHARGAGAAPRAFPYPEWRGGALRSGAALLVYAEQGLGDEIMFASCVPDLLARGISVVLECEPRLVALFARSFPGACVRGAARDGDRSWLAEFPQLEEQIAIGSLPRLLRRDVADFPPHCGYLHADPARVAHWRARLAHCGAGKKIGITWRGGTAGTRREMRSIPLRELAPLFGTPGVEFVNLQRDAGDLLADIPAASGSPVVDFGAALNDVDETAALLSALDGVIAADNSLAHLAGALGSKTWIILSHSADWRWFRGISTSPWYSSVTLCRQPAPGDWAGAIEQLGTALKSQL
jgi:tetratricopeptide (TPR) repeat protein